MFSCPSWVQTFTSFPAGCGSGSRSVAGHCLPGAIWASRHSWRRYFDGQCFSHSARVQRVVLRFPRCGQPSRQFSGRQARSTARSRDHGEASDSQVSAVRPREVSGGQNGVSPDGTGGHYSSLSQLLGQPSPHGQEDRWQLAAMWRLPEIESGHSRRQVPCPKHARSVCQVARL